MTPRSYALLVFLAALAGCVAAPAAPEPSSAPEPLRRAVPTAPQATKLVARTPNPAELVTNVAPHMFREKDALYITFFFNKRTGEQVFFEGPGFEVNFKLYGPDSDTLLVEQDVVMTADEQRFAVTLPASAAVADKVRCKFAAGLPDGRRMNGDTALTIAPDRSVPSP